MAAIPDSLDFTNIVLDLDHVSNIGHPCWEFLDPNPNIQHLFKRLNVLFFDGVLHNRVNVKWLYFNEKNAKNAGETMEPQRPGDKMYIYLNINILKNRSRKEIVEQLLHEMIHAYLIQIGQEDADEYGYGYADECEANGNHGPNFVIKMIDINTVAKLDITVTHDFTSRGSSRKISSKEKRYLWRCRGDCQNQVPYFGFIWIKEENREPNASDLMWIDGCAHDFERSGDEDPKQWLTEWQCVTIFNKFITANKIQIKSNRLRPNDINNNVHGNRDDDSFAINLDEPTEEISDSQYINYDDESGTFINLQEFFPKLYDTDLLEPNCTVCTICFNAVSKGNVIQHANRCSGLTFSMDQSSLPILMIEKPNQTKTIQL